MASAAKRQLSISNNSGGDAGIITRFTRSVSDSPIVDKTKQAAGDAAFVAKKLLKCTGKAAWIAGTTVLILGLPLYIEIDRELQFNELEIQQLSLLGPPPPPQV